MMMSDTVTHCTNYDGHIGNDQKNASEGLINQKNKQANYVLLHFPQHLASTKALMMECWSVIHLHLKQTIYLAVWQHSLSALS